MTLPALPKVFISSTVYDFRDLRSAIAYNLRSQGLTVHVSEVADFPVSGDKSAIDECLANVGSSDFYVLLIGERTGYLLEDGVSATRKEYQAAKKKFLETGRPRLLLYIRHEVKTACESGEEALKILQHVDDSTHLLSFVEEVKHPGSDDIPNFLTPFRDFSDVMDSLSGRLNMGKSVEDTLVRHSLVSELAWNLASMSTRLGHGAYPLHGAMNRIAREITLNVNDSDEFMEISVKSQKQLILAMPGVVSGNSLRTTVTEDVLSRGIFLEFDPVTVRFKESAIHEELQRSLNFIVELRRLDEPLDQSG